MTLHLRAALILGLALLFAACGDDDAPDKAGLDSGLDGGPLDARVPNDRDASNPGDDDAGRIPVDSGVDAGSDAASDCPTEFFPMEYIPDDEGIWYCPTRIALAAYCSDHACPDSLAAFSADFVCVGLDDDAGVDEEDGGLQGVIRREGCGSVRFYGSAGGSPDTSYFTFDRESGALTGLAHFSDEDEQRLGCSCYESGFAAGVIRQRCADDVVTKCRSR